VHAQNFVGNGSFVHDFAAWTTLPSSNGTAVWSNEDAGGASDSGSAFFTTTHPANSEFVPLLSQCVPVVAGRAYVLSQEVRFVATETTPGAAQIVLTWASSIDCRASISGLGLVTERTASTTWFTDHGTFTAPAGSVGAKIELGMDKDQAGGTLSAWVDDVSFVPSGAPTAEGETGFLPVAGSVQGNFGSNFKTSVRILNPASSVVSGRLVFHPAGQSADASDPSIGYALGPGQSFAWDDVVGAVGESGLGSLDVTSDALNPPVVVTRIFNDAGPAGTSGFTEPLFVPTQRAALPLPPAILGYLLGPSEVERFRYNVGIRNLGAAIDVTAEVLDPSGAVVHTVTRTYPADSFEQKSATDFAGGFAFANGHSLRISPAAAALIVYGATVDNATNDSGAQFLSYAYVEQRP
jgi:hypothetical protein